MHARAGSPLTGPSIDGVYDLPIVLPFQQEALGARTRVSIGGQRGEVILPRPDPSKAGQVGSKHPLLPPRSLRPRFSDHGGDEAWGKVYAAGAGGAVDGAAAVRRIMLRFVVGDRSYDAGNEVGEKVVQALPNWFRNVAVWLQALTQHDFDPDDPVGDRSRHAGLFMWGVDQQNQAFIALGRQRMTVTVWTRDDSIGGSVWRRALRHASTVGGPPLAWEILVAASRAARRGNGRRAIVEVGTAVEIALEQALRAKLSKKHSTATVETIMKGIRMLGPRIAFGKKQGLFLPSDLQTSLVEPRNRAAHLGRSPDPAVVSGALRIGRQVLEKHVPLR